jgi:putative DNA primase/helicase
MKRLNPLCNNSSQSTTKESELNPKHYAELTGKRKLSPEWVEANCRSIGLEEASELLGYQAKSSGILIQGDGYQQQFKPDIPWAAENTPSGKRPKKPKYRTPKNPEGQSFDVILPSHPTESDYWWDLDKLRSRCTTLSDGETDSHFIILTEGGFKAIAGCANEIPTIALLGVENGLTKSGDDPQGKRYLVPSLERLAKAGFGFIIGFDADCAENPAVIAAEKKLTYQLKKFKIPVKSITGLWAIEEGKGMDDYIANQGIEAFREKLLNVYERQDSFDEEKSRDLPPANVTASEIAEKYRELLAFESEYSLWWRYSAKFDGAWSVETIQSVRGIVHAYLECLPDSPPWGSGYVNNVVTILETKLEVKEWNEKSDLIPLQDGVLNRNTLELLPHNPGYRFTWQLPYKWSDSDNGCEPIEEFLLKVTGNPLITEVILCYLKAIVTRRSGLQRYLELIGGGGTGKSTLMKLAEALAGKVNTVSSQLKYLEGNQFEPSKLYRKVLTLLPDSERWQGEVSVLKQVTGQDSIRYERKGVQQSTSFVYEGMVILSANEPPESSDRTSGLERRKLTIEFDRKIPEYEGREDLINEFLPYLPGLLKKILAIPDQRVTELVKFTERYCPALSNKKWSQLTQTNSIAAWVDDNCCLGDFKGYIGVDNQEKSGQWLYANFCQFLRESGHRGVIPLKRFSANLRDLLKNQMKVAIAEGRDRNGSYIKGLGLRCFYDPDWSRYPSPLTKRCDGLVTDGDESVTAETLTGVGCDGCDGFLEGSKSHEPEFKTEIQHSVPTTENQPRNSDLSKNPSYPSHPTPVSIPAVTLPSQIHHTPLQINDEVVLDGEVGVVLKGPDDGEYQVQTQTSITWVRGEKLQLRSLIEKFPALISEENKKPSQTREQKTNNASNPNTTTAAKSVTFTELNFETYPHLTSAKLKSKKSEAIKIREMLLNAKSKEELSGIKDKWGNRCKWVWSHLSTSDKAKIKEISQTEQLKIDLPDNS